jgi:glycerol-3-phosphate acyltransferase PlsY
VIALLAALAGGYLLGAIPTAALVARARGKDVFALGSGNMGAMNTARNLNVWLGVLVLVLDVAKGAAATAFGMLVASLTATAAVDPVGSTASAATIPLALGAPLAAGFGAVLGHAWSAFVRFKGGKALATTLGVSLPLYPQAGLAALVLIVAAYLITRRSGIAAVVTMLAYPVLTLLALDKAGWAREDAFAVVTWVLPISAVVLIKHLIAWLRAPRKGDAEAQPG